MTGRLHPSSIDDAVLSRRPDMALRDLVSEALAAGEPTEEVERDLEVALLDYREADRGDAEAAVADALEYLRGRAEDRV